MHTITTKKKVPYPLNEPSQAKRAEICGHALRRRAPTTKSRATRKAPGAVLGEYDHHGYQVSDTTGAVLYSAGNHCHDSVAVAPVGAPEALPLPTIRKLCTRSAKDIAQERGAVFGGVERARLSDDCG